MSLDPEAIHAALFEQINGNDAFVSWSRKFVMPSDCPAALQPAVYQRAGNIPTAEPTLGLPQYVLKAWWFVYAQVSPDSGTLPATTLNALISAAVDALAVPEGQFQQLNGAPNVLHAYIDGEILVYEGLLPGDTQAFAVLPISIIAGS